MLNIHNHMQINTLIQISELVPAHAHLHMHIQTLQLYLYMDIALQICCRVPTEPHSAGTMKSSRSWSSSSPREACSYTSLNCTEAERYRGTQRGILTTHKQLTHKVYICINYVLIACQRNAHLYVATEIMSTENTC